MNKTNYFNNGQEFNAYYPSGVVPSNELGVVGSYNSIYSFIKDVFGIEGGDPLQSYIDITSNSNVDVSTYAYAYVNVPIPSGYIQPSGTKSITSNGTSDVTNYTSVNVNVPIPSGYIQPSGTKSITSNGTVDITTYANVNVAVPASAVVSGTKSITSNGTSDVTNYASVNVNVPIPSGYIQPSGTKSITSNGTVDITTYASVDVAVPASGITPTGTYNITANGTYDVTNYANAYVNVAAPTPQYTTLNLNTFTVDSSGYYYSTIITATLEQTIEVYNPNHLDVQVGPAGYYKGRPHIIQNGISSHVWNPEESYLEHLYVQNAPNNFEGEYSEYGFCITYYSDSGTPIDGVIYYRVF